MFSLYRWLYNLVGFSRSQSNAFIILLPVLILILFSEPIYRMLRVAPVVGPADRSRLDSLAALFSTPPKDTVHRKTRQSQPIPGSLRPFNPNTSAWADLRRLGFSSETAGRILKYRKAGGAFRFRRDLLRIHGLDTAFFRKIEPYVELPDREAPGVPKVAAVLMFDLNMADTSMLKKIRGIGDKLSSRIVKYRQSLGGFYTTSQLLEVYRLDTVVAQELRRHSFVASDFKPAMHDINREPADSLALHPYISRRAAVEIVTYRKRHGRFTSVDELGMLSQFDSVTLRRVKPYMKVSE